MSAEESTPEHDAQDVVRNIFTIAGLIIIAAIILWGLFYLFSLALPGLSGFFSRLFSGNTITLEVPEGDVVSGEPVDISWSHRAKEAGTYAFLYACRDGLQVRTPSAAGAFTTIPCGVMYGVSGEVKNIRVVPALDGADSVDMPITISFVAQATTTSAEKRPEGRTELRVVTSGAPVEEPARPAEAEEAREPSSPAAASGVPDLRVSVVSVGSMDYGSFTYGAPISPLQTTAVRFAITNAGTAPSGSWHFTASLPMSPAQTYTSPAQASLPAGYTGEYILQFRPVAPGGGLFSVFADAGFSVAESDESNNTAATSISMPYYAGEYPQYAPNYYQPLLAPYSQPYPYYGY